MEEVLAGHWALQLQGLIPPRGARTLRADYTQDNSTVSYISSGMTFTLTGWAHLIWGEGTFALSGPSTHQMWSRGLSPSM